MLYLIGIFIPKAVHTNVEVISLDYLGFYEFPFPTDLSKEEEALRSYFLSLSDEEQLKLLNASSSYKIFCGCVENYRATKVC